MHFRPKQLVDFSTYNTQIVCLTDAIISKAHDNDKYKYAKDSVPPTIHFFLGFCRNIIVGIRQRIFTFPFDELETMLFSFIVEDDIKCTEKLF